MIHGTSFRDLFQQFPKNSPLQEWRSYDLNRQYLLLNSNEKEELSPTVFSNSVAPRWKQSLFELILRTQNTESQKCPKDYEASEKCIDDLVTAFIEFFNSILFRRITSHQATGLLRDVLESCAEAISATHKARVVGASVSSSSGGESSLTDSTSQKDGRKKDLLVKSTNVAASKSSTNGPLASDKESPVTLVLGVTQVHAAALDALRWAIEYVTDLSEQMSRSISPAGQHSTGYLSSNVASANQRSVNASRSLDTSRYQQRILLLLEVVEKTGLLSTPDIIANIPCSQLDYVGYCKTRDQLTLMKFFVRFRTKDVFTLSVYNLESENPLGYGRLHVCLQTFIADTDSHDSCGCWKTPNSTPQPQPSTCAKVLALVHHVQSVVVEFQLCINRVTTIFLFYLQHYLFVFRHSLLDALLCLVSSERVRSCLTFLLDYYETNLTSGTLETRQLSYNDCLILKDRPYVPCHQFYHLCAYLCIEGLVALEELWLWIGPSDAFLKELLDVACQTPGSKSAPSDKTCSGSTKKYFNLSPSTLGSEEASTLLARLPLGKHSLIAAFINLNAWSCALQSMELMIKQCPAWSIHVSPHIIQSLGFLVGWIMEPMMSTQKPSSLEVTKQADEMKSGRSSAVGAYPCPYLYGLNTGRDIIWGVSQVTCEEDFRSKCLPLIELLGLALADLPIAFFESFVDVVGSCVKQLTLNQPSSTPVPDCYLKLYSHIILPVLCLTQPVIHVTQSVWKGLQYYSVANRYRIYANFYYHVKRHTPCVILACQAVHRIIGRELKRVTAEQSEAHGSPVLFSLSSGGLSVMGNIVVKQKTKVTPVDKTVMDALLKYCCANPFEVFDVILHHAELFDSMLIQVMINYLPSLPDLCSDIAVFLVTERQRCTETTDHPALSPGAIKVKKLRNLAHFIASFMRRFQAADVRPLLVSVASQIIHEVTSPTYPNQLSGYYSDMIYLVELITYMGGFPLLSNEELSRDQVESLGAGPNLRLMMLMDDARRTELYRPGAMQSRIRLQTGLLNKNIFRSLILGLSKLRLEVQYDCQLLCEARSLQLRLIAALTDEVQLALLQLINFIRLPQSICTEADSDIQSLALPHEQLARVLPSLNVLTAFCEPAIVWLLMRSATPPLFYLQKSPSPISSKDFDTPGLYPLYENHLLALVNQYYPDPNPGLQDLYFIFWMLDLQDISCPTHVYEKQIGFMTDDLHHISTERRSSPAGHQTRRSSDELFVQKELDVMVQRLNEWKTVFQIELDILKKNNISVQDILRQRKHRWFQPEFAGQNALASFVQHMLAPRLLNSQRDALYCVKFVQMLVDLDTEGFYIIDFFGKWTSMLTPLVRSCSIQEADYLGLFFNDMTAIINQWIRSPSFLAQYTKENRQCYAGLITRKGVPTKDVNDSQNTTMESHKADESSEGSVLDSSDLLKIIGKWENRIFRVIQHGLSLTERETSWMPQRIVIKFLNTTHKNFPITTIAGNQILRSLPALIERAKESRWDDVVANARALDRNLRLVESHWLKRKEDDEDDSKRVASQSLVSSLSATDGQEKTDYKKSHVGSVVTKVSQTSTTSSATAVGNPPVSHTHTTSTNPQIHSTTLIKGPKNPFHASFQPASSPRPPVSNELSTATSVPDVSKRLSPSSLPIMPRAMPPTLKRPKIHNDQTDTDGETKTLASLAPLEEPLHLASEPKSETNEPSELLAPKSVGIASLGTLEIKKALPSETPPSVQDPGTTVTRTAKVSSHPQDSCEPILSNNETVKPRSTHKKESPLPESEEHKFEKQKEIDALRQRMKSLHTYRSKSASSSERSRFFLEETVLHNLSKTTPSHQYQAPDGLATKDSQGNEKKSLGPETAQKKNEKLSGWSDEQDRKPSDGPKIHTLQHPQKPAWEDSTRRVDHSTKHPSYKTNVNESLDSKMFSQSFGAEQSSRGVRGNNDLVIKDTCDPRHMVTKRDGASLHLEAKDTGREIRPSQEEFKSDMGINAPLKSQAPKEPSMNEVQRLTPSNHEDCAYKSGSLHSTSRRRVTSRLPPPPPPPMNMLLSSPLHLESMNSPAARSLVSTNLNSRSFNDTKTDHSSLLRNSLSPALRNSQHRVQPVEMTMRQESSHHKPPHYGSRSLVSRNDTDEHVGRWHQEEYMGQPNTSPGWNDKTHTQRTMQGWYHHVTPPGAPQWASYKGSAHQVPFPVGASSRDRHPSQSTPYHHYSHRHRNSENGSISYSHQSDSPSLKRRQNHRGSSLKKSRSLSPSECTRRHRVQDETNGTHFSYAYSVNNPHPSSLRHKPNTVSPSLADYTKTRQNDVEAPGLRRSLHGPSSSTSGGGKRASH